MPQMGQIQIDRHKNIQMPHQTVIRLRLHLNNSQHSKIRSKTPNSSKQHSQVNKTLPHQNQSNQYPQRPEA